MHVLGDDMLKDEVRMRGPKFQPNWIVYQMYYLGGIAAAADLHT